MNNRKQLAVLFSAAILAAAVLTGCVGLKDKHGEGASVTENHTEQVDTPQENSRYNRAYDFLCGLNEDDVSSIEIDYCASEFGIADGAVISNRAEIARLLSAVQQLDAQDPPSYDMQITVSTIAGGSRITFELNDGSSVCFESISGTKGKQFVQIQQMYSGEQRISWKICDLSPLAELEEELLAEYIKENNAAVTSALTDKREESAVVSDDGMVSSYSDNNSRSDEYRAGCPGVVYARFVVNDTTKNYDTGFECWIERQSEDGSWSAVEPLGKIVQENSGSGHFYNTDETGRQFVCFDLACYPLLSAGRYRIVKPFWEEGSENHYEYEAYYEFDMVDGLDTGDRIEAMAYCEKKEYPVNARNIVCILDYSKDKFATSSIFDVERKEQGEWVSIRTGEVKTNSIGGSYSLAFDTETAISGSMFDLSKEGEYRVRISVGKVDDDFNFRDNYDTAYAYFKLIAGAEIASLSAEPVNTDLTDIDSEINVILKNASGLEVELKSADLTADGKPIECNYTGGTKYDGSTMIFTTDGKLPTGALSLRLTFASEGCKDTTVTVPLTVRKATDEEINSGVKLKTDKADYPKGVESIDLIITNKVRQKCGITILTDDIIVSYDDKITSLRHDMNSAKERSLIDVPYGKSVTLRLVNYSKSDRNELDRMLAEDYFSGYDEEKLNEYKKSIYESVDSPEYSMSKAGTYDIKVMYAVDDSKYDMADGTITIR